MKLAPDHWHKAFYLQTPLLELIVRGACLYIIILILMRVMPRRTGGEFLIFQAASHSLGEYTSIIDGIILISTFMALNYLLNFCIFHFIFFEKLVSPSSVLIIKEGKALRKNMRQEFLTMDELMEKLREEGIDKTVEGDGSISVSRRSV